MPACQDDDDSATCVKTGADGGLVLIPQLVTVGRGLGFGSVLDGVVNNQKVSTVARDGAADTDRNHAACSVVEVPVRLRRLNLRDAVSKKQRSILLNLVTVSLAELLGEVAAVTDLDDPLGRVLSEIERREGLGHSHGLAVTGRHEYHQPLGLPGHDVFQLSTHEVEVSGSFPPTRMNELDVISVVPLRQLITSSRCYGPALRWRRGVTPRHRALRPFGQGAGAHLRSGSHTARSEPLHRA